jgi:hypothetical protein
MRTVRPVIPHPTDPTAALVELTKGKWAVIDAADAAEVGRFNWYAAKGQNTFYAHRKPKSGVVSLHRMIATRMGLTMTEEVDHENGNGLDCRRSNLRDATRLQNRRNARLRSDNTSGFKGVFWEKQRQKWHAKLQGDNRRSVHVGFFASKEEAAVAVRAARLRLHGDFANHGESN